MTGSVLFLRSRGVGVVAALVAVEFVTVTMFASMSIRPLLSSRISFAVGIVAPVLVAMALGVTCGSPAAASESRSIRRLQIYRMLHLGGVLATSGMATAGALLIAGRQDLVVIATRNLVGFAGLALVTAALLRPSLSWTVPLLWLSLPPIVFDTVEDDPTGIWTFFAQPEGNLNGAMFATAVLVVGLVLAVAAEPPVYRRCGARVRRRVVTNALSASRASDPKLTNHSI